MSELTKTIVYGSLLLAGIVVVALILNHFFGAIVAGVYAGISIPSMVWMLYEMHTAPVIEDENPETDNNKPV